MVREHVIEELAVDDQDVVEIVQVVQVLSHQVTQLPPVPVSAKKDLSQWECFIHATNIHPANRLEGPLHRPHWWHTQRGNGQVGCNRLQGTPGIPPPSGGGAHDKSPTTTTTTAQNKMGK